MKRTFIVGAVAGLAIVAGTLVAPGGVFAGGNHQCQTENYGGHCTPPSTSDEPSTSSSTPSTTPPSSSTPDDTTPPSSSEPDSVPTTPETEPTTPPTEATTPATEATTPPTEATTPPAAPTHSVTATCNSLSIVLQGYPTSSVLTVIVDGEQVTTGQFAFPGDPDYASTFSIPSPGHPVVPGATHTYRVTVTALAAGFDTGTVTTPACPVPATVAPTTPAPLQAVGEPPTVPAAPVIAPKTLPATGSTSLPLVLLALGALAAGVGTVVVARRP